MAENYKMLVDILPIKKQTPLCVYVHNVSFVKEKEEDIKFFKRNINDLMNTYIEDKANHKYQLTDTHLLIMCNLIIYPYNLNNPDDKPFIGALNKTKRLLFEFQQRIQDIHFRSIIGLFEDKKLSFIYKTNEFELCTSKNVIDLDGLKCFIQENIHKGK